MPVRQDVSLLSINNKASSFTSERWVGIECASLAKADRDDVADNLFDGLLPLCALARAGDEANSLLFLFLVHHLDRLHRRRLSDFRCVLSYRLLAIDGLDLLLLWTLI